jgi:hypothetical protein
VVKTEIQREENKNTERGQLGNISVDMHRLVDPIAVTRIPENAAEIAKRRSLNGTQKAAIAVATEESQQQWNQAEPTKKPSPERNCACNGKRNQLQESREHGKEPQTERDGFHSISSLAFELLQHGYPVDDIRIGPAEIANVFAKKGFIAVK